MYLKICKWLEKISFKLKQKSLYYELLHHLLSSNESYIKPIHYYERGMGKTYTLIQLAHRLDIPIAVPTELQARRITKISKEKYGEPIEVIVARESVRGKRYFTILCDEGISEQNLHEIVRPMCKQFVGYVNIDRH